MLDAILTISLFCVGIHTLTREDCIFSFWQKVVRDPETLNYRTEMFHPVSECLVCMASFWTCLYLGALSDMPMFDILVYLSCFYFLLYSFVLDSKIVDRVVVFLYLIWVSCFLLSTGFGVHAFIVMIGVAGANRLAGAIIIK